MLDNKKLLIKLIQIVYLIFFSIFLFQHDLIEYNYTGLLNSNVRSTALLLCFIGGVLCIYSLYVLLSRLHIKHTYLQLFLLSILMLLTTLLPYKETNSLSSQLHLLSGLITFLYLHRILLQLASLNKNVTYFYLSTLFLCMLVTITFQSITGMTEWLFVCGYIISLVMIV